MKTYLTYGFAMAFVGALLNFAFYFLGYHSDPAKLQTAQTIAIWLGLAVSVVCIILGTRARRAEAPLTEEFGYGAALATGVLITLIAAFFNVVLSYLYVQIVNPSFMDTVAQMQIQKLEARGMTPTQIEQAETMMRRFMTPVAQAIFGFLGTMLFGTVISLITSAFLKRSTSEPPPMAV